MRVHRTAWVLKLAVFLLTTVAMSQDTSQQIAGLVQDSAQAVVPNATISSRNLRTGQVRTTQTNESGYYVFPDLSIGEYEVSAELKGFKKSVQTNLVLTVSAKLRVNVVLQVGEVTDSVTVVADAAQVNTSTAEVGALVTGDQTRNIQLNGRNFAQLVTMLPGVSNINRSALDYFGGYGAENGNQTINGYQALTWNVEGSDLRDTGGGRNNVLNVSPDAIAEFKVLTSNYDAEYGQYGGAFINVAMKSGTQKFHGSMYEYIRNEAFDARAFNALVKPKLAFNDFGWSLGGPVYIPGKFNAKKDKLFLFASQEFKRIRRATATTWNVPALALRGGDLSSLPVSQWPTDITTGMVFPNGVIPASRFSKNSKRLMDNYPAPNFTGTGGNFVFNAPAPANDGQYLFKVDYSINSKHQISAHYMHEYYYTLQNTGSLVTYDRTIPARCSSAKWTYSIGPSSVNTFQFSEVGDVINQLNFKPNPLLITDFTRTGQGINYPMIYGMAGEIPSISISGYNGLSASARNWQNFDRNFYWRDDFGKVVGKHSLKFGAYIQRGRKNQNVVPAVNGAFSFSTGHSLSSGNAFADALLGNFSSYSEANSDIWGWFRYTQAEFYAQDNWRATKRLTLNFGLRYFYMQPWWNPLQDVVVFAPKYFDSSKAVKILPSNGEVVVGSGDPYNGLALGGTGFPQAAQGRVPAVNDPAAQKLFRGLPAGIYATDWKLPAPRAGFAYDLTGKQATVIRGGYGLAYERLPFNSYSYNQINNPPFVRSATIYSGNVENPAGGTQRTFPAGISSTDLNYKTPTVQTYSFGVQQKVARDTLLEVSYVGSSSWNQMITHQINQLRAGTLQANPGVNTNALRPYPGYADISQGAFEGETHYNSLQVHFSKQISGGGLLNASYTWSKLMDNLSQMDNYGPLLNALSSYDRRHVFVFSYVYPLPFWRGGRTLHEKLLGGWQLSGVTTFQSGTPIDIGLPGDVAGIGRGGQRPNLVGNWAEGGKTPLRWFNVAAFAQPAAGTFGNLGRDALIGPGRNNWDASLIKDFRLTERLKTTFRAEFYNAPNHLSYFGVATTVGSSNFGQINSAYDTRTLQFALRMEF